LYDLAWNPTKTQEYVLAVTTDDEIQILNPITGELLGDPLQGHSGWINSLAWSPDGNYLASGGEDGYIIIWDATTGNMIGDHVDCECYRLKGYEHFYGYIDWVYFLNWSSNGKYLISSHSNYTQIYEIQSSVNTKRKEIVIETERSNKIKRI